MKWYIGAILGLVLTLWTVVGVAHELPGSTATVVLRDGLVTVEANLDIESWMLAQKTGDLAVMVASAKKQAASLVVRVDGKPIPMTLERFPTVAKIHEVLQRPAAKGHGNHPKVVRVQWRAARSIPNALSVMVSFPKAVGRVLVSFVEPRSQVVVPGGAAHFKSRRPQARPSNKKEKR